MPGSPEKSAPGSIAGFCRSCVKFHAKDPADRRFPNVLYGISHVMNTGHGACDSIRFPALRVAPDFVALFWHPAFVFMMP
jgi:hypothetical protein